MFVDMDHAAPWICAEIQFSMVRRRQNFRFAMIASGGGKPRRALYRHRVIFVMFPTIFRAVALVIKSSGSARTASGS
jgi:hypothetical protein